MHTRSPLLGILWAAVSFGPAVGQHPFDSVRLRVRNAIEHDSLVSVTVAVAQGGQIVWEEGFGWANRERGLRASPDLMYGVGSISKPFTATGLMILVERRQVRLDQPANHYLGRGRLRSLSGDPRAATVAHVMQHRSGLPTHWHMIYDDEDYERPDMDETIARYGLLVGPPGERYWYANLSYGVIEHIIARVTGQSYEVFMEQEVFAPLGLARTTVRIDGSIPLPAAALYTEDRDTLPFYDFDQRGAGAIWSSARDLARFGMFHLQERLPGQREILRDQTLEHMIDAALPDSAAESGYGLGWAVRRHPHGYRVVRHNGGMPGAASSLAMVPEKRLVVVALDNSRSQITYQLPDDILEVLIPDYRAGARAAGRSAEADSSAWNTMAGRWTGELQTWQGSIPVTFEIDAAGRVTVQLGASPPTRLRRSSFRAGILRGEFDGSIHTSDQGRQPHKLVLDRVTLVGDTLRGAILVQATTDRAHYALPTGMTVRRETRR